MEIITVLLEPKPIIEPFFQTSIKEDDFIFNCDDCGRKLNISAQDQISKSWIGKSDKISEVDLDFLKTHYNIGISNKSQDGGFSVFDVIICPRCESKYVSYCGVRELSNSNYSVSLIGLLKTQNADLLASIRNRIIDLLGLLGDYNEQVKYAKEVTDYIAIQEMYCMWSDDNYKPENENFIKAFSKEEFEKLKEFSNFYCSIIADLPKDYIINLHDNLNWRKLVDYASRLKYEIKNAT
jgi:hypothetical protein